jgi:immunity protein 44 of polymorphic toxin system
VQAATSWLDRDDVPTEGQARRLMSTHDKRRKVAEYRLKIDYRKFRDGDPRRRQGLICESLLCSIDRCGELKVGDFDGGRFRKDVDDLCRSHGWL